ncbi:kinesin-like protein KIN-14N [Panicum hallii]|uniref:kinesin-like protein KIN-14N n=1 Tax=Panicum hallii TaxID=206008 RepID=UPI000DF4E4B5|nr:kinesin-like protein KIN-14N [Panicum hallii]
MHPSIHPPTHLSVCHVRASREGCAQGCCATRRTTWRTRRPASASAPPPEPGGSRTAAAALPLPPPEEEHVVFAGREDVEALLNQKMKGKNKMDYKGKSEQMMEYIKKLWACIKWLLERQDANLIEIGNTSAWLEAEGKEHSETVAELKNSIDEARSINEELQKQ